MSLDDYAASFPVSPTMTHSVAKLLRQAILDGALQGGTVIRQEEVARKFGVSRVPVREALLKLEGEGLVETQPRRGVVVTMLSTDDFEEILEMRMALESQAIERAARRFKPEDAAAALEIVEQARTILGGRAATDSVAEFEGRWGALNWEFHRRIYGPAGRPRLLATIENLQQLFARHMRVHFELGDAKANPASASSVNLLEWAAVLSEHEQIALACSRNDAPLAVELLRRHIMENGTALVARLRAAHPPVAQVVLANAA